MERKSIKCIFNSSYKDLSQEEQRIVSKIIYVVTGIIAFCLAIGYLSLLQIRQKDFGAVLGDTRFLYFILMIYVGFLLFGLVYKKRIFRILKIASFLFFCILLIGFGFKYGSLVLQTSGFLVFFVWVARFFYTIFHSAEDTLIGKDEEQVLK